MLQSLNILVSFFICINIIHCCPIGEPAAWPKSTIYYVIDDRIDGIAVNKNQIFLHDYEKSFNVGLGKIDLYLLAGDIVSISASNIGDFSFPNPAFILATINYYDNKGRSAKFNTGLGWVCDGVNPLVLGSNSDFEGSKYWKNNRMFTEIEPKAQMIWNPNKGISTTCSFKIPCY